MKKSDIAEAVSHLQECMALIKPGESIFLARLYCLLFEMRDDLTDYLYSKFGQDIEDHEC